MGRLESDVVPFGAESSAFDIRRTGLGALVRDVLVGEYGIECS